MTDSRNNFFLFLIAIALAIAAHNILVQTHNLDVTTARVDDTPITVAQKPNHPPAPAVVIAHGFSGSQQLMAPMATTLAQNGYVAVTFDFSGHGRNQRPMTGGIRNLAQSADALMADIERVVAFARRLPGVDGRIALAGHSMATDLVVRAARRDPGVTAVVALSFFAQEVTATAPKNLLIVDGAWESQRLIDAGLRAVSLTAGGNARPGVSYGDVAAGDGRRLALARGAEHIGVLYSQDALSETVAWLNAVFDRSETDFVDRRGPWLAPASAAGDCACAADAIAVVEGSDRFHAHSAWRLSLRAHGALWVTDGCGIADRARRPRSPYAGALNVASLL